MALTITGATARPRTRTGRLWVSASIVLALGGGLATLAALLPG